MRCEGRGPMLVVDASSVSEVLVRRPLAAAVLQRMRADTDHLAPHILDVEVFGVIRKEHLRGTLDTTSATLAVGELRAWKVERFPHGPLLARAWELRDTVRGWDAMYVALAEALDAVLLTTDGRLARARGPRCAFELITKE